MEAGAFSVHGSSSGGHIHGRGASLHVSHFVHATSRNATAVLQVGANVLLAAMVSIDCQWTRSRNSKYKMSDDARKSYSCCQTAL